MATTRLLRTSNPLQLPPSSSSTLLKCARYASRASFNNNNNNNNNNNIDHISVIGSGKGDIRKPVVVAMKASTKSFVTADNITTATSSPPPSPAAVVIRQGLSDFAAFIWCIRNAMLAVLLLPRNYLHPQMVLERLIMDCRFFTVLAVAGSLLGSVLCFLEGCVLVMESYAHYLLSMSQRVDIYEGNLVHLLIEAIDVFLVGTALLVFGVGLYVMFVRSATATKAKQHKSNLLGLFYMKSSPPGWVGMQSKIGHAVMMILQVGLLDKFKDVPLATGFDLACFSAALLTSSASIFVLSRLHNHTY